jgi:hypothetical protein
MPGIASDSGHIGDNALALKTESSFRMISIAVFGFRFVYNLSGTHQQSTSQKRREYHLSHGCMLYN